MNKFILVFVIIFSFSSVFAAVNAPVDLIFYNNASIVYDEGVFTLNWSSGTGDSEVNYSVFIFSNGTYSEFSYNDSLTGYSFSNFTEANYTFIVQSENLTGDVANSSNISLYVDSSSPNIILFNYTNDTFKKNSDLLSLDVYVSDSLSGVVGANCLIEVNGTNQSVSVSGGWCNSSSIYLSGLSDGNNLIHVYVDDAVGNIGINESSYVSLDSTAPVAIAECSSNSVYVDDVLSCICVGSDSLSGINDSLTSTNGTQSTDSEGSFTYVCSVTDNAGNIAIDSISYEVTEEESSSSGSIRVPSYRTDVDKLKEGYTFILAKNYKVNFEISEVDYVLTANSVSDVLIASISNSFQNFQIIEGENKKFDFDEDGSYDLEIYLEKITGFSATIFIKSINESIESSGVSESIVADDLIEDVEEVAEEKVIEEVQRKGNSILILFIVVISVVIVSFFVWKKFGAQLKKFAK